MAHASSTQVITTLRAITYRVSSTSAKQLPHVAGQIAASLWSCRDIISASPDSLKSSTEGANILHRFKTTLTSLLQDRTPEGRWAAVVLTKATIEAGGIEILSKSNPWVRSLLGILKKPDPPTTRNLAVITLTRIFMLTWDHSTLVRETTTPALPTFISSCLNNIEKERCSAIELQTVLEAFATLVPRHPTIFRTHEAQVRSVITRVLSPSSSAAEPATHFTKSHQAATQRLLVLLHHCAPKQGAGEKWDETFKATIASAHGTCDLLFRSVLEIWQSSSGNQHGSIQTNVNAGEIELLGDDAVGLGGWKGLLAGSGRLSVLLGILEAHLTTATASTVAVRIGLLVDLLTRLFNLAAPTGGDSVRANTQIPRDESEALFSLLPQIHAAGLALFSKLLDRFGQASVPFLQSMMQLMIDVYRCESSDVPIRLRTYNTLKKILETMGPSMAKEDVAELGPIIKGYCDDLLSADNGTMGAQASKIDTVNPKSHVQTKSLNRRRVLIHDLHMAATSLLPTIITKVNPAYVPRKLRVQIERTAVITQNKDALVACVLCPAKKDTQGLLQTSLLPLLVRQYPESPEVEALLRPRMPPVVAKAQLGDDADSVDLVDEDENLVDGAGTNGVTANGVRSHLDDQTGSMTPGIVKRAEASLEQTDHDELYSSTPDLESSTHAQASAVLEQPISTAIGEDSVGTKRQLEDSTDIEAYTKRLRVSPIAEALAEEPTRTSLPGLDPVSAEAELPVTAVVEKTPPNDLSAEGPVNLPAQLSGPSKVERPSDVMEIGGDDSDFEMPPLTLDPDTDPEDEDEDEDEDEVEGQEDEG